MRAKSGFTLVEILIVVVILGILAAIVIPQFTDASTEAKTSSLMSDLQTARSQIELYKIQHNDDLPGTVSGVSFADAMTERTTQAGALSESGDCGPYLQKIPTNPFTTTDPCGVEIGTGDPGTGDHGWYFNTESGEFNANDSEHSEL